MILVLDFGSQTTHLIGRRIRDIGGEVKIILPEEAIDFIKSHRNKVRGIILSGGPASIYEKDSPQVSKKIFSFNLPILGICYGWQLMAHYLGGKVVKGKAEYGPAKLRLLSNSVLFSGIKKKEFAVWMSHGDEVVKLPPGFRYLASTAAVKSAAAENSQKKLFGLQFHPEVRHSQYGEKLLANFVTKVCREKLSQRTIKIKEIIQEIKREVESEGKEAKVVGGASGGIDSTVAGILTAKAIGKRFLPLFCDNGLMRKEAKENVVEIFKKFGSVNVKVLNCRQKFFRSLKGVVDPEEKRKIIGRLYVDFFEKEAKKTEGVKFLLQGTIYSDAIESKGSKHASKIKSHHNVGGLPEKMNLRLLEPLRNFYKDEVRKIGKMLGLPKEVIQTQPFPGPGYAIRILGEVNKKRAEKERLADEIVTDVLKKHGWYEKVFQSFAVLTGVRSTAVKGDARLYGEVVAVRIYGSSDIMTANWTHLPYEILQEISSRIVSEVPDVSRVVYDITTKPPATMEWE